MTGQEISRLCWQPRPGPGLCRYPRSLRPHQQQRLTHPPHRLRPRPAWPGALAVFGPVPHEFIGRRRARRARAEPGRQRSRQLGVGEISGPGDVAVGSDQHRAGAATSPRTGGAPTRQRARLRPPELDSTTRTRRAAGYSGRPEGQCEQCVVSYRRVCRRGRAGRSWPGRPAPYGGRPRDRRPRPSPASVHPVVGAAGNSLGRVAKRPAIARCFPRRRPPTTSPTPTATGRHRVVGGNQAELAEPHVPGVSSPSR